MPRTVLRALPFVLVSALALSAGMGLGCQKRGPESALSDVQPDPGQLTQLCEARCARRASCGDDGKASAGDPACAQECVSALAAESSEPILAAHDRCLKLRTCEAFDECEAKVAGDQQAGPSLAFRSATDPCFELCSTLASCDQTSVCDDENECEDQDLAPAGNADPSCMKRCSTSGIDTGSALACLAKQGCEGQVSCMLTATTQLAQADRAASSPMPGVAPQCSQFCDRAFSCTHALELSGIPQEKRRRSPKSEAKQGSEKPDSATGTSSSGETPPELTGARVECGLQCTRELALNGGDQVGACLAHTDCTAFLDCASEL